MGEEPARPPGVRRRGGRALRERGTGGAGRVRRRGHRLGAAARLRAALNGREQARMATFTVLNPATEQAVATVPSASAEETDAAIARAVAAQAAWRAVAPGERAALLRAFAEVVDAHIDELAALETAGSGHPAGQARWEAGNVRDVLLYYSAAPERLCGKQIPVPGGLNVTFQEPVGVVGLIVPWNFPMPILGW